MFSVGHTGGDLSLPEEVRRKIQPKPFPVADGETDWVARVTKAEAGPGDVAGTPGDGAATP